MSKSSWTILEIAGKYAKVRCTCGYTAKRNTYDIKSGKSVCCRSCSYTSRKGVPINVTHGLADSPTMNSYSDMKRRCYDQSRKDYKNYGGRGITVQKDWLEGTAELSGFSCFVRDLGMRPSKDYQLDRKDNNLGYCPSNCWFTDRKHQQANRRAVSGSSSKYVGVSYVPRNANNPWVASIKHDGSNIHIGSFPTELEASHARDSYVKQNNLPNTLNH